MKCFKTVTIFPLNSLERLIGETLVFGIPGLFPTTEDLRLFRETGAGGLILYRTNFRSPAQVRSLIRAMEEGLGRRLLVTLDHEVHIPRQTDLLSTTRKCTESPGHEMYGSV